MTELGNTPTLVVSVDDERIATCTFNRPEVRNALNRAMVNDLHRTLDALSLKNVRALVFTGAGGKAFLSGADIEELRERRARHAWQMINTGLMRAVEEFPAPTIAAVQGWALGGGCEMAMACDMRVAGQGARFGQPEVTLGIVPGAGAMYRLPRLVGSGRARELIFTGRIIDAAEAERIGLVNRVVADDEVITAAQALAHEIAANAELAVRYAKQAMNALGASDTLAGTQLEASAQAILFEDEEKDRRMGEFLARRAARKQDGGAQ